MDTARRRSPRLSCHSRRSAKHISTHTRSVKTFIWKNSTSDGRISKGEQYYRKQRLRQWRIDKVGVSFHLLSHRNWTDRLILQVCAEHTVMRDPEARSDFVNRAGRNKWSQLAQTSHCIAQSSNSNACMRVEREDKSSECLRYAWFQQWSSKNSNISLARPYLLIELQSGDDFHRLWKSPNFSYSQLEWVQQLCIKGFSLAGWTWMVMK